MRKPAILAIAAAAAACLASAHALALEPPRPLTGPELQALLTGNTLIGSDKDGFYWMYYADGDTVWGRSAAGDVDIGSWWIENDSYCRSWRRWYDGETRCWQFSAIGGDVLVWHALSGEPIGRSTLRNGNAIGDLPGGAEPGLLVDAGSGLSSELDAVVARAEVEPLGLGSPSDAHGAILSDLPTSPAGPTGRRRAHHPGEPVPPVLSPLAPSSGKRSSATASAATGGARVGGFLDRLGVRSGGSSSDGAGGGSEGGGGPAGKGGTDRD
jgi:hypothetical protein